MILRRLTEHLKQLHWTAIGVELLIVVLGVFIGMQVSNWNEARVDRAAYLAALDRLIEEIDTNLAYLAGFDVDMEDDLASGSRGSRSCSPAPKVKRAAGS